MMTNIIILTNPLMSPRSGDQSLQAVVLEELKHTNTERALCFTASISYKNSTHKLSQSLIFISKNDNQQVRI